MPYKDLERRRAAGRAAMRRYRAAHPEKVREDYQQWRQANLEKARAKSIRWNKANPEKARASVIGYRAKNGDRARARTAQWRLDNPERVKAAQPILKEWKASNPDKVRVYNRTAKARYRADLQNPTWSDKEIIAAFYAARPLDHEVDHIVPFKGRTVEGYPISGLHVSWNLQYLPKEIHAKKINRMRPEDQALCES